MEGMSGEKMRRRRREYSEEEDTRAEDMSASEEGRRRIGAREARAESSESDEVGEVSVSEVVRHAIEKLRENEVEEGDISRRVEDALEELERMEQASESAKEKIRDALESLDEQEKKNVVIEEAEDIERGERVKDVEKTTTIEIEKSLERNENQDLSRETPSRIQELDESWVKDVLSEFDSKEWNQENLAAQLMEISDNLPDTSRTFYIDVEKSLGISAEELDSFKQAFHQVREGLDEVERVRFGLAGERLYVWRPDFDSTSLEKVYDSLYYYFRDKEAFDRYIDDVGESLGFQEKRNGDILKYLRELAFQMVVEDSRDYCINPQICRIRGDFINLMNDISGKTLSGLEGEISKVTGPSGRGGIERPLFPHGEKLEVAVARLVAAVLSDGSVQPNGGVQYAESEMSRIERVVESLRVFGDINLSIKHIERENYYRTHFPSVIGKLLMHREVPSGDRTIQNPRLSTCVREGTDEVKRAYIEDFIPQDACVGKNKVIWHRANVLDAGDKSKKYGLEPKIGIEEKVLIMEYGRRERGNAKAYALSWGKLEELTHHPDVTTTRIARSLECVGFDNPNRLMDDEAEIMQGWGIKVKVEPSVIRYYSGTGRVTITWQARTVGLVNTIELCIVAPPNDIKNKQKAKILVSEHREELKEAVRCLKSNNIEYRIWWDGS
nr:MAG: hypothetical protein AM325_14775 [Candidatus Thorarchaeota archaeon SMTZ1-45]